MKTQAQLLKDLEAMQSALKQICRDLDTAMNVIVVIKEGCNKCQDSMDQLMLERIFTDGTGANMGKGFAGPTGSDNEKP